MPATSSTAKVCIVIGTGYIGAEIHDEAAITQLPISTAPMRHAAGRSASKARKGAT